VLQILFNKYSTMHIVYAVSNKSDQYPIFVIYYLYFL